MTRTTLPPAVSAVFGLQNSATTFCMIGGEARLDHNDCQLVGQYSSPLKSSQPQQTGGGEHSELGIAPTLLSNNAPGHEPGSSVDGPAPMLDDLPPSDPELSSEESSDDERARAETPTPEPRALRSGKAKVNLARVATGMQEAGATAGSPMMKYSE